MAPEVISGGISSRVQRPDTANEVPQQPVGASARGAAGGKGQDRFIYRRRRSAKRRSSQTPDAQRTVTQVRVFFAPLGPHLISIFSTLFPMTSLMS